MFQTKTFEITSVYIFFSVFVESYEKFKHEKPWKVYKQQKYLFPKNYVQIQANCE